MFPQIPLYPQSGGRKGGGLMREKLRRIAVRILKFLLWVIIWLIIMEFMTIKVQ